MFKSMEEQLNNVITHLLYNLYTSPKSHMIFDPFSQVYELLTVFSIKS